MTRNRKTFKTIFYILNSKKEGHKMAISLKELDAQAGGQSMRQGFYAEVPISMLKIDPERQRPIGKHKVKDIANNFNRAAIGALIVIRRMDGYYYVADGQHRMEACRIMNMSSVPCIVHENLSLQEEAEIFLECNNRRKNPSRIDNFIVKLGADKEDAVQIKNVVENLGLKLNLNRASATQDTAGITAIGALEYIYKRAGSDGVRRILEIVKNAWPEDRQAMQGGPLRGLFVLIEKYKDKIDDAELIRKLREKPILAYRQQAVAMTSVIGGHQATNYARVFLKQYNYRKTTNRLDDKFLNLAADQEEN